MFKAVKNSDSVDWPRKKLIEVPLDNGFHGTAYRFAMPYPKLDIERKPFHSEMVVMRLQIILTITKQ
jgi:hypothetical protein